MKIKSLLITVLACFVIIPSVVFACIANVEMNKLAMKNYKQTAQSMAENQTYNISEYFRIISASAKQIADNPDILSFDKEKNPTTTDALAIYSNIASADNENVRIDRIMIVNKSDFRPVVGTNKDFNDLTRDDVLYGTLKIYVQEKTERLHSILPMYTQTSMKATRKRTILSSPEKRETACDL